MGLNKYLEKALWTILFDKGIGKDEIFIYTNPINNDQLELSYNQSFNDSYHYHDSFIGVMIAHPDNIHKVV
jgi:hypothetical protein